jgi:hypothetical protein
MIPSEKPSLSLRAGRYLIDFENPDAGIGHSMGHVNNAVKICLRHGLVFAYSDSQVRKSSKSSWKWRVKQFVRKLTFRQVYETHNIGDDINRLFAFGNFTENRAEVERLIRKKKLRVVRLPPTDIRIPSNDQNDDVAYQQVDSVVASNPGEAVVFVLPEKRVGDFEYAASLDWFKKCYFAVQENHFKLTEKYTAGAAELHVAVHIRRGDLLPGRQFSDLSQRMLPDRWYLRVLKTIANVSDRHLVVHIVSEGVCGRYCSETGQPFLWDDALPKDKCRVFELIDGSFVDSFRRMINADVLIGSKSGMSHLAALLGNQLGFMPRMWHSYKGAPRVLELSDSIDYEELCEVESLVRRRLT